jgi:hypothetical protein
MLSAYKIRVVNNESEIITARYCNNVSIFMLNPFLDKGDFACPLAGHKKVPGTNF